MRWRRRAVGVLRGSAISCEFMLAMLNGFFVWCGCFLFGQGGRNRRMWRTVCIVWRMSGSSSRQWDLSARSRSNVLRSCKQFTPVGFSANESQ